MQQRARGRRQRRLSEGQQKQKHATRIYTLVDHRNKESSNTKDYPILNIDGASCVIQVCVRVSDGWILRLRLLYTTSLYINVSAFDILLLLLFK